MLRLRQMPPAPRYGIMTAIVLLLGFLYWIIIVRWLLNEPSPEASKIAWQIIVWGQFLLICLIAPIVAANTITKEKEQQTWESLIFTSLAPGEIIFGKLMARLSIIVGILLLFLPVELFCILHNIAVASDPNSTARLTMTEIGLSWLTRILCTLFFATLGLFLSWLLQRTLYAIMASYTLVVGIMTIATALFMLMLQQIFTDSDFWIKCPLMWVNPVSLMVVATNPTSAVSGVLFLLYGLIVYAVVTLAMLWRMVYGFRRFAFQK
ncbi:MAG TPA: hypothetical protein VKU00_09710 [Chthonomonadaceae bacterium]|nr:hypothetical protein [Chthonomonadaceae bacterium]